MISFEIGDIVELLEGQEAVVITRKYANQELGKHGEKLVESRLKRAGIPVKKMPVNHPGFDLMATVNRKQQRISVKCRGTSNINVQPRKFDWLAIVLKEPRRIFIFPRKTAIKHSAPCNNKNWEPGFRRISTRRVPESFAAYENNFRLKTRGSKR
jgi:hypothetical protein